MIVRDAEATIERCIRSALPLISHFTIVDTGCVDDTIAIAKRVLGEAHIPGQFLESTWVGHAHNRSEALEFGRHECNYLLMLDADMELVQQGPLPDLTADSYLIAIHDRGLVYPLPLLTSTAKSFYYHGVAHAYLACRETDADSVLLPELTIIDHGGGGGRPGKIERDRDLLALEVARNPSDSRSWFYLAQSFRDVDEIGPAIECYKRRASLGGWDEEVYWSMYQAGVMLSEHVNAHEGMKLLLDAYLFRPSRAEALRALAGVAASVAEKIPLSNDVLFVRSNAYKKQHARPAQAEVDEIFFHRYKPRAGDTVVELGAAEGTETGLLATLVGLDGTVIAVEAHPRTFERLEQAHGDLDRVTLIHAAVAPEAGTVTLTDETAPWHNRIATNSHGPMVRALTLDEITADLPSIDLLKINIEGLEAEVLAASSATLAKTRHVVVSCHDFVGMPTKQAARAALVGAGFDVRAHDEPTIIEDGHGGRCLGDYWYAKRLLRYDQISAVIVTRGDVDLGPTLEPIPVPDVCVWDNSQREDLKTYGRIKMLDECANSVAFTVDDDVIFTEFDRLIDAYEPNVWTCNMDDPWIDGAGYRGIVSQSGAGSIYDKHLPQEAAARYLAHFPYDDEFLTWCDAIVGTLAPWQIVDLGFAVREFSDDPGRLWTTPGGSERKWDAIRRCQQIIAGEVPVLR